MSEEGQIIITVILLLLTIAAIFACDRLDKK